MFYNRLCSPSSANGPHQYCNRVLCQHLCVIPHATSSPFDPASRTPAPAPAQHQHRQTHPNAMPIPSPESCPPTASTPSAAKTKARQWARTQAHDFRAQKVARCCDDERYRDDDIDGASMSNVLPSSPAFRYFVASPRASARRFIVIVALINVDTRTLDAKLTSS
jgi:hypothetical protein